MSDSIELYRKHRPSDFSAVVGQTEAVAALQAMLKRKAFPHSFLFTGPSGTGKTTLARIVASKLECGSGDLVELNAADTRGIDTIRDIARRVHSYAMGGKSRIWIIDEAGKLSNDAQTALLKVLEELPSHAYVFLCTTDPQKLIPTIKNRCTEIRLVDISSDNLKQLLRTVAKSEGITLTREVGEKIIDTCNGSARLALVLLNKIAGIEDEDERIEAIARGSTQAEAIELARCIFGFKTTWPDAAKILSTVQDEPEAVRYLILGYARSILLKGGNMVGRAAQVIEIFQFNTFDSKNAGLALMVFRAMSLKR